jgi:hypothetical protein
VTFRVITNREINPKHHEEETRSVSRFLKFKHLKLAALILIGVALLAVRPSVILGQQSGTRVFRGSIGGKNIEMRLDVQGTNVSGNYRYDSIGEDLKVTGHLDPQGRLELIESVKKKPTGKFVCKRGLNDPIDPECSWTRPDGTREAFVTLAEQHVAFRNGLQIIPKTIADRTKGVSVSYPQLTNGDKPLSAAATAFNRRILGLTQKAVREFEPGPEPGRNSFETNYNVLLANDEVVSIEMSEYSDVGAAHPNSRFWSLTYDLTNNKDLELDSLFKPESDYKMAIAKYVVADIDRRADAVEADEAKRAGRQPKPREESIVSIEELSDVSDWGMTPQGLVVYFDFPHVIAYFDKNFIPYNVVKDYLKPNTPASRFQ